ncbi:MAG: hypothetical protein P1V51_19770 [Deltaproteobacteria bacterium]|nr:hypothetical protein [Deltaproteobacteria bacterium]
MSAPSLDASGSLRIPFDCDPCFRWWDQAVEGRLSTRKIYEGLGCETEDHDNPFGWKLKGKEYRVFPPMRPPPEAPEPLVKRKGRRR